MQWHCQSLLWENQPQLVPKNHTHLRFLRALTIVMAGLVAANCGGFVDPAKNQVETFSATLQPGVGAINFHLFTVSRQGEYSVTFVSMNPPASIFIQIALGQGAFNQCVPFANQSNIFSTAGRVALSSSIVPGSYCVLVADEGFLTVAETYTIQVSHP